MSTDLFRVGRGGAGNWYSKKDLDDAEKRDIEAQNNAASQPQPGADTPAPPASLPPYVRSGRGGAGNFYDTAAVTAAAEDEAAEATRLQAGGTAAAPAAPTPPVNRPRTGLSGRGGAGNWSAAAAAEAEAAAAEDRRRKQAVVDAQVQQDVEAGLPMPPRAYHLAPEQRERKK